MTAAAATPSRWCERKPAREQPPRRLRKRRNAVVATKNNQRAARSFHRSAQRPTEQNKKEDTKPHGCTPPIKTFGIVECVHLCVHLCVHRSPLQRSNRGTQRLRWHLLCRSNGINNSAGLLPPKKLGFFRYQTDSAPNRSRSDDKRKGTPVGDVSVCPRVPGARNKSVKRTSFFDGKRTVLQTNTIECDQQHNSRGEGCIIVIATRNKQFYSL